MKPKEQRCDACGAEVGEPCLSYFYGSWTKTDYHGPRTGSYYNEERWKEARARREAALQILADNDATNFVQLQYRLNQNR